MGKGNDKVMIGVKFIFSLICAYFLGNTLHQGLSAENMLGIWRHEIPFVYTVGIIQMGEVYLITLSVFLSLYIYYVASLSSLEQIKKLMLKIIWGESIIFTFIFGTWNETDFKKKLIKIDGDSLILSICMLITIGILIWIVSFSINQDKNKESDLYPSRERVLRLLDFYLKTCKGVSVIGDWGIGKTKLIENFFYRNLKEDLENIKNNYELIYMDVSSFSENKKIIETIEYEINKILKKYKILKLDEKLVEKLFEESNGTMKSLKNLIYKKANISDSKKMIAKKILELKEIKNKEIVICLDNIERISDMDRIINLLAIVDDLTPSNIIKMYVYDKNYMKKVFNEIDFNDFIEKYSEVEVEVKEVDISEIVEKANIELSLLEGNTTNIELKIELLKISFDLSQDDYIRIYNIDAEEEIENEIQNVINENMKILDKARKKISNPRYIYQVLIFIKNNYFEYNILDKLEYKIWIDNFNILNFEDNLISEIFFSNLTPYEERKKKEVFQALYNLEKKVNKYEVDINKESLLNNAKSGEGSKVIEFIDFCIESKAKEDARNYFSLDLEYKIRTFKELENFFEYYNKYNYNLENIKINYKKIFLSSGKTYGLEKDEKIAKVLFLRNRLKNIRLISRLLLDDMDKYEKLYMEAPLKFEDRLKNFGYLSLDEFVMEVKKKYNKIKTDVEFMEDLEIDKDKIVKEFEFFKNIKLYQEEINKEWEAKIKPEILLELSEAKVKFDSYFKIFKESIVIKINLLGVNIAEEINSQNINDYKKYLKELKIDEKNYLLQMLKREVIILERNLKNKYI